MEKTLKDINYVLNICYLGRKKKKMVRQRMEEGKIQCVYTIYFSLSRFPLLKFYEFFNFLLTTYLKILLVNKVI